MICSLGPVQGSDWDFALIIADIFRKAGMHSATFKIRTEFKTLGIIHHIDFVIVTEEKLAILHDEDHTQRCESTDTQWSGQKHT